MDRLNVRRTIAFLTLLTLAATTGCVVVNGPGRGRGYHGHPHGGPPGHTGFHPGRGHGR